MNPDAIEAAARAMAIQGQDDGCFLEVDAWEALEEWERDAHPDNYPGMAYEDCEYWRGKASAALEAAAPYMLREARAAELEAAADDLTESAQIIAVRSHDTGINNAQTLHAMTTDRDWLRARAAAIRAGVE